MNRTLADVLTMGPYNYADIARSLDVPRSRVTRWAHGGSVPEVQHLPTLATLLGMSVEDLTLLIARDRAEVSRAS